MMWSDDPLRDADRYAEEGAEWEAHFPVCQICGEHIVEGEDYFEMESDELYHWECFETEYKKEMGDWHDLV